MKSIFKSTAAAIALLSFFAVAWSCENCSGWPPTTPTLPGQIKIDSSCYRLQPRDNSGKIWVFDLTYYFDAIEGTIVGGFIHHNNEKENIPLLFKEKNKLDDYPELENFEIVWLEITKERVTGSYSLIQEGAGIKQGRYMKYTNFNSKKEYIFFRQDSKEKCKQIADEAQRLRIPIQKKR